MFIRGERGSFVPHRKDRKTEKETLTIKGEEIEIIWYLCAWGNDAASEVLTEARQLLVENYFQTPSLA